MNTTLWVMQGLLAFAFVGASAMKLLTPKEKLDARPEMGWSKDFTAGQVKLLGLAELLGAIGLIVPWATQILPVLTPIAALCLTVIMGGAAMTHIKRKESPVVPLVLAGLAIAIAVGRSGLL
jgi:hypothetical protein